MGVRHLYGCFKEYIILQTTNNSLLLKIEELFNRVLMYEDEELQAFAREQIPIVTLQLMALDRVREQQKLIKTGWTLIYFQYFPLF